MDPTNSLAVYTAHQFLLHIGTWLLFAFGTRVSEDTKMNTASTLTGPPTHFIHHN